MQRLNQLLDRKALMSTIYMQFFSNQTVLEFLEAEHQADDSIGSFVFQHEALHFEAESMPHLKMSKDEFNWKKLDFEWLKTAHHENMHRPPKTVHMPERVDLINIHAAQTLLPPYKEIKVRIE